MASVAPSRGAERRRLSLMVGVAILMVMALQFLHPAHPVYAAACESEDTAQEECIITEPGTGGPSISGIDPGNPGGGFGRLSVSTNSNYYVIGQWIQFCISLPFAGEVQLYDRTDWGVNLLMSGYRNGGSNCYSGTITPPSGNECLLLAFSSRGRTWYARKCFFVDGGGYWGRWWAINP